MTFCIGLLLGIFIGLMVGLYVRKGRTLTPPQEKYYAAQFRIEADKIKKAIGAK